MKAINEIEYLSQRDPRWYNVKMGESNILLGRMGCTSTCIAMLTDFYDCKQSPAEIAQNFKNYFDHGPNICWSTLDFPTFSFRWRECGGFTVEKPDMDLIKAYMKDPDKAVLLEVANYSHWVVALWENYDGDIRAIDPWTGKDCMVYKDYGNITGAALFVKGKTKNRMKPEAPNYD